MTDREIRAGLVGCGGIADMHFKAWANAPGAKVVAVCDVNEECAARASEVYGAQAYTDLAQMLERSDIDAVDICTVSGLHAEQGMMALSAGKHAIIEKPIDIDIKKVDALIEMADKTGLVLACIFNNRFGPEIQKAKQLIDEGALGRLIAGSAYTKWWRGQEYYDSAQWRGTWALDGGCFSNQGIHAIDQLCWMCGPVERVDFCYIETAMHHMEAEDFGIAALTFENGAHGIVEATTCCYPGMNMRTEVFGTKGSAVFEGPNVKSFTVKDEDINLASEAKKEPDPRSEPLAISAGGHTAQILDFVESIRDGRRPMVDGREARVSIDALTKMYNKAGITKLGT
ncbi:MAG: hypothetical protein A2Z18_07785 [Armatimonadetes bacterium RBG_16_58_9]|nr:MAG: hypothetical protein A2Z18_07785 [Armatimonadetes bacterium RBG_16_58_9]